eukprot:PhF_6_TR20998/c0_g1_i2/m.30147
MRNVLLLFITLPVLSALPDSRCQLILEKEVHKNTTASDWEPLQSECSYARTFLAIHTILDNAHQHSLQHGVQVLKESLKHHPNDWVGLEVMGLATERIARKLHASGGALKDELPFLNKCIQLLSRSTRLRVPGRYDGHSWPPAAIWEQPRTIVVKALGNCYTWSRNPEKALLLYQQEAKGLGWEEHGMARPNVPYSIHPLWRGLPFPDTSPHFRDRPMDVFLRTLEVKMSLLNLSPPPNDVYSSWHTESAGLHRTQSWDVLLFAVNGIAAQNNCSHVFPNLTLFCEYVLSHPFVSSLRDGQVKASRMKVGTHIRPHAGPSNGRLRVHCTLWLPSTPVIMTFRVGTMNRTWLSAPSCFLFDESYEHEVWIGNASSQIGNASSQIGNASSQIISTESRGVMIIDVVNILLNSFEDVRKNMNTNDPSILENIHTLWQQQHQRHFSSTSN